MPDMTLSDYLKSNGVPSVKALAKAENVTRETISNWWKNKHFLIEAAIKRYREAREAK